MNIIIPDIDKYIISLSDLRSLVNLLSVNKFFHRIISIKPIIHQWKHINSIESGAINNIFLKTCKMGFLEYANYLVNEHNIDIHAENNYAFRQSCLKGHLKLAQWLIQLGESDDYTKIDIHAENNYAFRQSCLKGHLKLAQWLVELGESNGYTKIDIHAENNYAFRQSCLIRHYELAQWLVQLSNNDYGKFNKKLLKMMK